MIFEWTIPTCKTNGALTKNSNFLIESFASFSFFTFSQFFENFSVINPDKFVTCFICDERSRISCESPVLLIY
jgi:hypothetical protein